VCYALEDLQGSEGFVRDMDYICHVGRVVPNVSFVVRTFVLQNMT